MVRNVLRALAACCVLASGGLAHAETVEPTGSEPFGSEGVDVGAAEVSDEQTAEAEDSRSLGPGYYGRQPIAFLSNNGKGYSAAELLLGEDRPPTSAAGPSSATRAARMDCSTTDRAIL